MEKSEDKLGTESKGSLDKMKAAGKLPKKKATKKAADPTTTKKRKTSPEELLSFLRGLLDQKEGICARYHVVENDLSRYPVTIEGNLVKKLSEQQFASMILRHCQNDKEFIGRELSKVWNLTMAGQFAQAWVSSTKKKMIREELITPISFAGDDALSWCVLPFSLPDTNLSTTCPTWEEILSRMSQPQAFMDFMATVFLPETDRQQYLWLYGSGGNGKSSITSLLADFMGSSAISDTAKVDTWMGSRWAGKRLVYFPDTNNYQFVTSGMFKAATGADNITVEEKYSHPISIKPIAKFIFTSNERPNIGGDKASLRRIIFIEMQPLKEGTKMMPVTTYHNLLKAEFPEFLACCIENYWAKYKAGDQIEVDESAGASLVAENEMDLAAVVEEYLNVNPDEYITGPEMRRVASLAGWKGGTSDRDYRRFTAYLKRTYGVRLTRKRIKGKVQAVWEGISPKHVII